MRKLMGFVLLCVCLSSFYYRFSQIAYQNLGESVALEQLESLYTSMYQAQKQTGSFTYDLSFVKPHIFKNQSFGFRNNCLVTSEKKVNQKHLMINLESISSRETSEYEHLQNLFTSIINEYSDCADNAFKAVVVHKAMGQIGIYRIDQNHQIEIVRSSRLGFSSWLWSILKIY